MRSFFRYPGGKSKLREKITARLVKHKHLQYREPFFGGGSIGLNIPNQNIWINDKDIGVACLWTSVIQYPEDFKNLVNSFIPSVTSFHKIKEELINISDLPKQRNEIIEIGFKKLAIHQISYSGLGTKSGGPLGGEQQKSKYKIDCRWSPKYICKKIDTLHNHFNSIDVYNKSCTNLDFSDLIKDTLDSILYLDPPYYTKGNELYQYGFTLNDHVRLSVLLKSTRHWMLSYDDCQSIRDLYKWAKIEELNVNYNITATKDKNTGERLSIIKSELLISND